MALLALMTVTLLSVHHQRTTLETNRAMLDDEMEVMASGIALQAMEYIGTKSFDANTVTGVTIEDESEFSVNFPTERNCTLLPTLEGTGNYDTCDDLGDFNQMQWEKMPFIVGGDTLLFEVMADVRYIDQNRQVSVARSFSKEVVVTVRQSPNDAQRLLLRQPVRISRTFSY